jgi:hypothetical protein
VLCWFVDCFSILLRLTLDIAHWFRRWTLWTTICPISGSRSTPAYCQPVYLSRLCLLKVPVVICSLSFPLSPVCSVHPAPSAACSFSVPCLLFSFFFLTGQRQSVQGTMLVYPKGSCGNTHISCCLFAHLLVCVSQAGLELASGGTGALLFSQCNVAWRSFVQARGSECWCFASSWWFFFCQVCLQQISANFLIYGAHAVCFLPLVKFKFQPQVFVLLSGYLCIF